MTNSPLKQFLEPRPYEFRQVSPSPLSTFGEAFATPRNVLLRKQQLREHDRKLDG
jgi:hypothetical protein